jgi:hypothetical protein
MTGNNLTAISEPQGVNMKINITTDFSKAFKLIEQLRGPELKKATANALNDAAFEARKRIQGNMDKSFGRVTPYIRKSVLVTMATADKLEAVIEPRYMGGKGVDPQKILQASIFGGDRRVKRSEKLFLQSGILPAGMSMVPGGGCPLDAYGNIKGSFIVQLLSYFQSFSEQGYRANMTDKRKAKLKGAGRTTQGFKTINGVVYFVSYGKMRSGRGGTHLAPGIWAKTGIHGSMVKPIIMFVKKPHYGSPRLDFFDQPVKDAIAKFNPRFRYHMRNILEGKA